MAKIEIPSKIRAENFKAEDRNIATQIGAVYNQFVDQIYGILQKKLGFDNLNRQYVQVTVTINSSGEIANSPAIKLTLLTKPVLVTVGKAQCLTNNLMTPTGYPFPTWEINNNTLAITKITNLQSNTQYTLNLEIIGE